MNPDTGHIHVFEDPKTEELKLKIEQLRKKLVDIPEEELERVINMNRRQRLAWAAQQKKL